MHHEARGAPHTVGKEEKWRRERRPFYIGARRCGTGRWKAERGDKLWGRGLAMHPGDVVGRQRPDRGGSRRAMLMHVVSAEQERGGGLTGGPRYSPGRRGQIRLNCFKNIQNFPNFDQSKFELPKLQKFGKKY
jgi:hypothetical protein